MFPSLLFFFPYLEDSTEPTDEKRLEFPVFSKGSKLKWQIVKEKKQSVITEIILS